MEDLWYLGVPDKNAIEVQNQLSNIQWPYFLARYLALTLCDRKFHNRSRDTSCGKVHAFLGDDVVLSLCVRWSILHVAV